MSEVFERRFASRGPDVCITRLQADESVCSPHVRGLLGRTPPRPGPHLYLADHYDPKNDMSAMTRSDLH